jgi:hypothetical protein
MYPRLDAPIIIVGNGGSGTTLLDRTLNAHPSIEMLGEMKYLVVDAWTAFNRADANTTLRNVGEYFDSDPKLEARIKSSPIAFRTLMTRLERDEMGRRTSLIREMIAEWFCLNTSRAQIWGFKEITNNGARQWDCYDLIFPAAIWVHVIRHPMDWLFAAARLSGQPLSEETIPGFIKTWIDTVEMSRRRRTTGRYHEIKYEELHEDPQRALTPLFSSLGLNWHDECCYGLQQQWGERSYRAPLAADSIELTSAQEGLKKIMNEYGYSPSDKPPERRIAVQRATKIDAVTEGGSDWRVIFSVRSIGAGWSISQILR